MGNKVVYIWEGCPKTTFIHRVTNVTVYQDEEGKPVIRLSWPGIEPIFISINQAEMIGSVAIGAKKKREDFYKRNKE